MLTIMDRISGVEHLLNDLYSQAKVYRLFLVSQAELARADKAFDSANEPRPIPSKSMHALDEELRLLNEAVYGEAGAPSHFFVPYHAFGPQYAETYTGPSSLMGGKSVESLSHDYVGIMVWIGQMLNWLSYLKGAMVKESES